MGYFLSSEEFGPRELVGQARLAEQAGFERLWISDHYHPWNSEQGQSPFVWSVFGALSEATRLPVAAVQHEGRFVLGVGSGEALNEHNLGAHWPAAPVRLEMLEEALGIIRVMHTGKELTHHGKHYTVENAVKPDASSVRKFRESGGDGKPTQSGFKVCYAPTVEQGVRTAHRIWATSKFPVSWPSPRHFEQASTLVTPDMVAERVPCGPDPSRYVEHVRKFIDAGYDEVYVSQIGPTRRPSLSSGPTRSPRTSRPPESEECGMPDYSEDYDEDNLRLDPLEGDMDPPEHWKQADKFGNTEAELHQGQDLDHRLDEEQPDLDASTSDEPRRPVAETPDGELDESIDDLTDDADAFPLEDLPDADPTGAVQRGQSADEAGGSVADEIRTPPSS